MHLIDCKHGIKPREYSESIKQGTLTMHNATVENFDANSNYQNESSNEFVSFPEGYALIE
jgi:hypothetical protein